MRTVKSCILGASPSVPVESGQCTRVCIYMFGNIKERCRCARAGAAGLPVVHNPQSSQTRRISAVSRRRRRACARPCTVLWAYIYFIVGLCCSFGADRHRPRLSERQPARRGGRYRRRVSLVRESGVLVRGGIRAPRGGGSWGPLYSVSSVSQSEPLTSGVSCQCVRVRVTVRCVQKATSLFICDY